MASSEYRSKDISTRRTLVAAGVSIALGFALVAISPYVGIAIVQILIGMGIGSALGMFGTPQVAALLAGMICAPVVLIAVKLLVRHFDFLALSVLYFTAAILLYFVVMAIGGFRFASADAQGAYLPFVGALYLYYGPAALVGHAFVFWVFGRLLPPR